ncbi:MAG: hypothetical protein COA99_19555 [Moraxellaceae bacterium]|nr:MAG: hypothetical protein COA99_19555 [Moraxellaceae bacterium]
MIVFLKIINLSNSDFNIIDLTLFYYTLSSILNVIIFIKKGWDEKFTPKYYKISLFKLWLFKARKFWIFGLIGLPITQLDSIILGSFSDYDSLAYYSIVNKYFLAACYTWVTVMIALNHPIITHSWEKKEFLDIEIILKKVLFSALIVFFVATSLFEFYYSEIIDLFLHEKISSSELNWRYIFYFSFLLKILSDVYLMFFIATSKMQIINKITLVQAILSFILQLILYKLFGLTGLITAIVITYAFSLLFLSFNYYKIIRIAT